MGKYDEDEDVDEEDVDADESGREQRRDENALATQGENRKIQPLTITLDDPAGNSFIEFVDSTADPRWNMRIYPRTLQQNIDLGLVAQGEGATAEAHPTATRDELEALSLATGVNGAGNNEGETDGEGERIGGGLDGQDEEIYVFPGVCSSCGRPLDTMMKKVNIPYFKVCHFKA